MPTKKAPRPTQLAARRREIMDTINALTKEKAELDEKLLSLDLSQDYVGDGVALSFTPVHTLDTAFITKKFPASKRPEFYKLSLDTSEFKKHFSPNELEDFQRVSYRIKIDSINDGEQS